MELGNVKQFIKVHNHTDAVNNVKRITVDDDKDDDDDHNIITVGVYTTFYVLPFQLCSELHGRPHDANVTDFGRRQDLVTGSLTAIKSGRFSFMLAVFVRVGVSVSTVV